MEDATLVEYYGENTTYQCGYCGGNFGRSSYGMPTHMMSVLNYQALIDRGWRRSGRYCYKPALDRSCCPPYTIRCKVLDYKFTKSRKKVLNKMRKFLMSEGDEEIENWRTKCSTQEKSCGVSKGQEDLLMDHKDTPGLGTSSLLTPCLSEDSGKTTKKLQKAVKKGVGADLTKPQCKKAKLVRLEKKKKKFPHFEKGDAQSVPIDKPPMEIGKTFHDHIPHLSPDSRFRRKLEIRLVRAQVGDNNFEATRKESHQVYQKYQQAIHGDLPSRCTERQWLRFLVDSSLTRDPDGPGPGYGNYHQQYVLDGKIIAVGVIDILPNSLSSVYLYYDPDYGFLSLGIYAALSEIAYTQLLHEESEMLQYYYMGFYIHSCKKMRYKSEYPPSELLCPETFVWVPVELCKPALDQNKYSRLNTLNGGSPDDIDPHNGENFDIDDLGILYEQGLMNYDLYKTLRYFEIGCTENENSTQEEKALALQQKHQMDSELKELKEYIFLVGDVCAKRMFLSRQEY